MGAAQFFLLAADLLDEHTADGANAADEEVELLVFAEEERIVDDVERLAQIVAVDGERYVGLACTLCAGDDADAAASESAEQFAGDAGGMFHVLSDDCDCCEAALGVHGEHGSILDFLRELMVEHTDGFVGIFVAHTD